MLDTLTQQVQFAKFIPAVDQDVDIPVGVGHAQVNAIAQANIVQAD
jgi:hypothetical protein